jgi:hypothetical protein
MNKENIIQIPPFVYKDEFLEKLYSPYINDFLGISIGGSLWDIILLGGMVCLPSVDSKTAFLELIKLHISKIRCVYKRTDRTSKKEIYLYLEGLDSLPDNLVNEEDISDKYYSTWVYSGGYDYMVIYEDHFKEANVLVNNNDYEIN